MTSPATPRPRLKDLDRRPAALVALVTVVGAISAGAVAAPAEAGTYAVWSCRGPAGEPLPTVAWAGGGTAGTRSDDCAGGGALRAALAQTDITAGAESGYRFVLPAGTTIAGWRTWFNTSTAATEDGSSYSAGVAEADPLGVRGTSAGCLVSSTGCSFGTSDVPLSDANLASGQGTQGLAVIARCLTSSGCSAQDDPGASVTLYRSAVDIDDPDAPAIGAATGPLVAGSAVHGTQSVVVPVADGGSGIARTDLLIDGAPAQTAESAGSCVVPYVEASPCPTQTDRAFVVDTAGLTLGEHVVSARATDGAGNTTTGPSSTFVVTRPTPDKPATPQPPDAPTPAVAARTLTLALPSRVAVPERTPTRGRASWSDGTPAAGLRLDVLSGGIGRPTRAMHRITRVRTTGDGSFTLPRTGSSRTIRVVPSGGVHREAAAETDLVQPLGLTLRSPSRAVRNGSRITLRGRVSGAGDAAEDLPVLVQAIVRGRWSTVADVRPDDDGHVRWTYRFQNTLRAADYRFRFVVNRSTARPWSRTVSPRRIVRVRP